MMTENRTSVSFEDLYFAYECCRCNKKNKDGAKKFESAALFNLTKLLAEINSRTYKLKPSMCFLVHEPTIREVFCADFRDRIVQHFVYNELNPVIEKVLIKDTCSCRLGKGTDYAIERLERFVRRETENYTKPAYYLKLDLSGFFMSIDRHRLLSMVLDLIEQKYKGCYREVLEYLVPIIILSDVTKGAQRISPPEEWEKLPARKTLFGNPHGLPIGNICSQLFANFYLSPLDHLIKCAFGCASYVRYVDDMVIVDPDRDRLKRLFGWIRQFLPRYNMRINEKKSFIKDVKYGVPFLGIDVKPFYSIMSRRRINKLYKDGRTFATPGEAYVRTACRRGNFLRYHGRNIAVRWYSTLPDAIRRHFKISALNHESISMELIPHRTVKRPC